MPSPRARRSHERAKRACIASPRPQHSLRKSAQGARSRLGPRYASAASVLNTASPYYHASAAQSCAALGRGPVQRGFIGPQTGQIGPKMTILALFYGPIWADLRLRPEPRALNLYSSVIFDHAQIEVQNHRF